MTQAHVVRARRGSTSCGDAVRSWYRDDMRVFCVVDGLGHGEPAETAAQAALAYVEAHLSQGLTQLFADCDRSIGDTRGVAMGIARIDMRSDTVHYAAVGNTRALLLQGRVRRFLVSSPGIVGGGFRHVNPETWPIATGDRLFMYTDGFPRRLDDTSFRRRLDRESLQLLANSLLSAFGEDKDDNALLVYQHERPSSQRLSGRGTP